MLQKDQSYKNKQDFGLKKIDFFSRFVIINPHAVGNLNFKSTNHDHKLKIELNT